KLDITQQRMRPFERCPHFRIRSVGDDDDLDVLVRLGKRARYRQAQFREPPVGRNNNADEIVFTHGWPLDWHRSTHCSTPNARTLWTWPATVVVPQALRAC